MATVGVKGLQFVFALTEVLHVVLYCRVLPERQDIEQDDIILEKAQDCE